MHERIKELSLQAQKYAGQQIDEGADWDDAPIYYTEKFAELIVQDLIHSMIKRYGDDDELPIQEIKLFVKEHFGVEE